MTRSRWIRRLLLVGALAALGVALVRAFLPEPLIVDTAVVARGPLRVTTDNEGRTRVRERYTISAPIRAQLTRIDLDPGDAVQAGTTILAQLTPTAADLLDPRSRAEAEARLQMAEASVATIEARREQSRADAAYTEAELAIARKLTQEGIRGEEALRRAERDATSALQGLRAAESAVEVARFERDLARAGLNEVSPDEPRVAPTGAEPTTASDLPRLTIRSPIDGVVLRVLEESARILPAGTPILEVGRVDALEVVADYLSQEAVRVEPGMAVEVHGWGGVDPDFGTERILRGRVRHVEPGGFTEISALGVEEQRVNVLVDPEDDAASWRPLGDGYRVELRIVLWEAEDILQVPAGALFWQGSAAEGSWHAYAVRAGRATLVPVTLGRRTGLAAQVVRGLEPGDEVVLYPTDLVGDGTPVTPRTAR